MAPSASILAWIQQSTPTMLATWRTFTGVARDFRIHWLAQSTELLTGRKGVDIMEIFVEAKRRLEQSFAVAQVGCESAVICLVELARSQTFLEGDSFLVTVNLVKLLDQNADSVPRPQMRSISWLRPTSYPSYLDRATSLDTCRRQNSW